MENTSGGVMTQSKVEIGQPMEIMKNSGGPGVDMGRETRCCEKVPVCIDIKTGTIPSIDTPRKIHAEHILPATQNPAVTLLPWLFWIFSGGTCRSFHARPCHVSYDDLPCPFDHLLSAFFENGFNSTLLNGCQVQIKCATRPAIPRVKAKKGPAAFIECDSFYPAWVNQVADATRQAVKCR